ncbi:MAG: type ISP restriction/modification enzyme [Parvibaculum sp.]|uniref:type ISP restriction/modification enzyme n=1 Tax=Parvibaculum sp. TaxID=2024848 RepID=UPI0032EB55C5
MAKFDAASVFDTYLKELRKTPLDDHTEHTGRSALESLLNAFVAEFAKGVVVQHEPKRAQGKGAPDFKLSKTGSILGYVENKAIGENLDQVLKSDQIKKYKTLSGNILLTDYLHWVWIGESGIKRETLCFATDLESPKFKVRPDKAEAVAALIKGFLSTAPEGIGRAQTLALALAARSQILRDFLGEELVRQEREHKEGRLFGLYGVFKDQVFHDLTLAEFADAFAQMLAYGLFLARLNSGKHKVTLQNARQYVPGSFRLIRELVQFLDELTERDYRDIRWVVEEILSIVNALDLHAIHEDLSFRHRKVRKGVKARDEEEARLFERDPFVYFYEDFLAKYDAKMKKARGVYYTPPPVVNFIVRAVDDILKKNFDIKTGLADRNRVTVLDFACGTGTFLVEILERILEQAGTDSGKRDLIVREHILKNIYGFEYLLAPYTIAHLKLSQYLTDKDHKLSDDERLQIFLTNTLEPIEPQKTHLLPALTAETEMAQEVKEKAILVITGNPPYAGHSKNNGPWIKAAIDEYKFTWEPAKSGLMERKPLKEKNLKWLQDDYVKFIRFSQMKMDAVDEGVVAIITNHAYLNNRTFRGMRQSLMRTFDQIYILDLHGSQKPKESPPDGIKDENVFDIQKGVAIALFVKAPNTEKTFKHHEFWGSRIEKYKKSIETSIDRIEWTDIEPTSPHYLFIPQNRRLWVEYEKGQSLRDIFSSHVLGFQTHRDHFSIAFDRDEVEARARRMRDSKVSDTDLLNQYRIKDNRDWQIASARKILMGNADWASKIRKCVYRPFDTRACYFGYEFMDYPRRELMDHVAGRDNLQLLVSGQIGIRDWQHVFVGADVAESCAISDKTKEGNYNFPLYLYAPDEESRPRKSDLFAENPFDGRDRIENLKSRFRSWIDKKYEHKFSPEEVLGFIYAVLHSSVYREKYNEFLRTDFPRVPFPDERSDFELLSTLGWELAQSHLLQEVPDLGFGLYRGKGDHEVVKPHYVPAEKALYINEKQSFAPVPENIWDFHIGSYQVVDKYLKSRKGRKLSLDEIEQVERIVNVLAFTITQMEKIDKVYKSAFGE